MIEGHEVLSATGAVAAGPPGAARAGAWVLEQGGNAMDAAAAASMACCMLQPAATGIGGYVLAAVVLEGATGKVWSLDANSPAPIAARDDMFEVLPRDTGKSGINENEYLCSVTDDANIYGPLSVAVPGMMAGMGMLWERWGRLRWEEILTPSRDLLDDGFPYDITASNIETMAHVIRRFDLTAKHLMPTGQIPGPDDVWHRPDMEKTLERLSVHGWRDFYTGDIGHQIADYLQDSGGILTREDMAVYEARISEPYAIAYRNAHVYGPVLSNGCISSLQILNLLNCLEPALPDSLLCWHQLAEVLKLAWRDRLKYVGDPDFVDVPVERLLSPSYAMGRTETLRQFPWSIDRLIREDPGDSHHGTLHVSAADVDGNVVAVTITHGATFGSCVTVPGTGIILGHGMSRLDPRPGLANSVAAGKRPLNNVAPMVIRLPDRDVATGVPGGRRIISVGAQLARSIIDYGATSFEAADAPRMHVQTQEPIEVTSNLDPDIVEKLRALGHDIQVMEHVGFGAHCAEFLKDAKKVRAGGNTWAAAAN